MRIRKGEHAAVELGSLDKNALDSSVFPLTAMMRRTTHRHLFYPFLLSCQMSEFVPLHRRTKVYIQERWCIGTHNKSMQTNHPRSTIHKSGPKISRQVGGSREACMYLVRRETRDPVPRRCEMEVRLQDWGEWDDLTWHHGIMIMGPSPPVSVYIVLVRLCERAGAALALHIGRWDEPFRRHRGAGRRAGVSGTGLTSQGSRYIMVCIGR